ncbi:MAG: metallophosphoesterase [Chloroflexi bacterium]|nr:metallophosphoesterase [Chloroflexota bacterium]
MVISSNDRHDLVVVHSSDLHLGSSADDDQIESLQQVIEAARRAGAHVLIFAGDLFDSHRQPPARLERICHLLADAAMPIVILPGNHDPLTPDSVYRRGIADPPNVRVIGLAAESLLFPEHGLEIWGRAHRSYDDMPPLSDPPPRTMPRAIAVAHGHWVADERDHHRSWLIWEQDLAATGADYVALGHWERAVPVGSGAVPAHYSGSPGTARTVHVVRFTADGAVEVSRYPVDQELYCTLRTAQRRAPK